MQEIMTEENKAAVSSFDSNGYIYAITHQNKTKIGTSKRPNARVSEIISISGIAKNECEVTIFESGKAHSAEQECHKDASISGKRIGKTEWFNVGHKEACSVIESNISKPVEKPEFYELFKDQLFQYQLKAFHSNTSDSRSGVKAMEPEFIKAMAYAKLADTASFAKVGRPIFEGKINGTDASFLQLSYGIFFYGMPEVEVLDTIVFLSESDYHEFYLYFKNEVMPIVSEKTKHLTSAS